VRCQWLLLTGRIHPDPLQWDECAYTICRTRIDDVPSPRKDLRSRLRRHRACGRSDPRHPGRAPGQPTRLLPPRPPSPRVAAHRVDRGGDGDGGAGEGPEVGDLVEEGVADRAGDDQAGELEWGERRGQPAGVNGRAFGEG